MKRLVSLTIIIVLFSQYIVNASFIDTADKKYEIAADVVVGLGLMKSFDDGTFRGEDEVTRGEFADIIAKILSFDNVGMLNSFNDVDEDNAYAKSIGVVSTLKIMNGDGKGYFNPNGAVSYNEAIKALICLLGYEEHAIYQGGYPFGYLLQASKIGLTKGVDNSGVFNRATAAQLIYNALDIEVLRAVGFGESKKYEASKGNTLLYIYRRY